MDRKVDVMMEYYLQRVGPNIKEQIVPLIGEEFLFGREVCPSPHVSRNHALFQRSVEGLWFVKDMKSLNGLYKNRKKLVSSCLHPLVVDDHVGFGVPYCKNDDEFEYILRRNSDISLTGVSAMHSQDPVSIVVVPDCKPMPQNVQKIKQSTENPNIVANQVNDSPDVFDFPPPRSASKKTNLNNTAKVEIADPRPIAPNNNCLTGNTILNVKSETETEPSHLKSKSPKQIANHAKLSEASSPNPTNQLETKETRTNDIILSIDDEEIEIIGEIKSSCTKSVLKLDTNSTKPNSQSVISKYFNPNKSAKLVNSVTPDIKVINLEEPINDKPSVKKNNCLENTNIELRLEIDSANVPNMEDTPDANAEEISTNRVQSPVINEQILSRTNYVRKRPCPKSRAVKEYARVNSNSKVSDLTMEVNMTETKCGLAHRPSIKSNRIKEEPKSIICAAENEALFNFGDKRTDTEGLTVSRDETAPVKPSSSSSKLEMKEVSKISYYQGLINEVKRRKCFISITRLPKSIELKMPKKSKRLKSKVTNSLKRSKRQRRVNVIESTSESEPEAESKKTEDIPPVNDILELDFDKSPEVFDDTIYSQMDDVIWISDDEEVQCLPKIVFVKKESNEESNADDLAIPGPSKVTDEELIDNIRFNHDDFFPVLSQAFYENNTDKTVCEDEGVEKPTTKKTIQLTEPLALKPRPKNLCGKGEWMQKEARTDIKTSTFYSRNKGVHPSKPISTLPSTNYKTSKKKIDLKTKLQANMGHRIPIPGGGSDIRKERRSSDPEPLGPRITRPQNIKAVERKRKTSTCNLIATEVTDQVSIKKKKVTGKITSTSRMDKFIATTCSKSTEIRPNKPLVGFKIPKKKPSPAKPKPLINGVSKSKSFPGASSSISMPKNTSTVTSDNYNKKGNNSQAKTVEFKDSATNNVLQQSTSRPVKKIRFSDTIETENNRQATPKGPQKSSLKTSIAPVNIVKNIELTPHHAYTPDKFLAIILKWNVRWLEEQTIVSEPPPLINTAKTYQGVRSHYLSIDEHFKTYFPLIILETWESIYRDWNEEKLKLRDLQSQFVTTQFSEGSNDKHSHSFVNLGETVLETVVEKHQRDLNVSLFKEGMLIIFDQRFVLQKEDGTQNYKWSPTFGYIKELKCLPWNPQSNQSAVLSSLPAARTEKAFHLMLFVKFRCHTCGSSPKWDKPLPIKPVTYLRPTLRQVESLINLHNSPLAKTILTPQMNNLSIKYYSNEEFIAQGNFNETQRSAIMGAAYVGLLPEQIPKIVLIQGPPGTGKTYMCVGLIQQLLFGTCSSNKNENKRRLLVLAPSNAAIDEIARRLIKVQQKLQATGSNKKFIFVRVGQPDSIHNDIKPYSIDEISISQCKEKDTKQMEELNEGTNVLEAKINSLNGVIIRKLHNKENVSNEQAQINQNHLEIKKLESRKIQLSKSGSNFNSKDPQTKQLLMRVKRNTITSCDVILTTLTSCRQSIIEQVFGNNGQRSPLYFTSCIVDEASQCSEPDLLLPLQYQISKLIMVGDPQQLPATILSQKATKFNFQKSLFERYYDYFQIQESPIVMLTQQYRMHSEIAKFPSRHFYKNALQTSPTTDKVSSGFPLKPYIVFDLEDSKETANNAGNSFHNDKEAKVINQICLEIMKLVPNDCTIGIITPYQAQRRHLIRTFAGIKLRVEINTVDAFQGREKDIIILSSVRANDEQAIGFLKCAQRLNVAITRACKCLIICGHLDSLNSHIHWKSLVTDAKQRNLVFKINSLDNISTLMQFLIK